MKILVTGNSGFIGRHLLASVAAKWPFASVYGCDPASSAPYPWGPQDALELFKGDDHFDLVLHCAALTGGIDGITKMPARIGAVNMQLDGALFEWALRTKPGRVVYFSSSCVYPLNMQTQGGALLALQENDALVHVEPDATYGWVKLTGEVIAEKVREAGVPVSIVRPFAVYGSDQEMTHVVPMFAERARWHAETFTVWGDGAQTHDFIHVDDVCEAVRVMVENGVDGPVNLGTGIGTSIDEVARLAMWSIGYKASIFHDLDKPTGVAYRVADVTKLHEFYVPKVSIEEGVARAVKAVETSYGRGDDRA